MEPDPPPRKLSLTKAGFKSVNELPRPGEPPANEPLDLLRQNREHEKAAGTVFDQSPAPVKKKSRRLRDYLIIMVAVDSIFGFFLFLAPNPILFAGILLFTAALTWGMLVLIDDY